MRRIDVNVLTPDGLCPSVVIAPDGEGSWPAVIMFMDAGGVRQGMVEMAERLAGLGYVAFLPEMYYGIERWPRFEYYRRYRPAKRPGGGQCSVGVAGGLPGTPFWFLYHRETPNFRIFADRIMASRFAAAAGGDGGHLWLPLRVSADRSGATIVGELIEGIEAIRAIAEEPEVPGDPS